ncbi:hypothetical protein O1611_g5058 [Lasiodiplodia mahajangana]|uniref:Uncharacterized protein n=1 Tax=Lasiodiplodia mahajangana TaxID=1108764 RepID=A0ACC2JM38_9PEZI|nr:hypothetical protein O1611_g5058 [Lasiodiplodia mahajangana]
MDAPYLSSKGSKSKGCEEQLPFLGKLDDIELQQRERKRSMKTPITCAHLYFGLLHVLVIGSLWALYRRENLTMVDPIHPVGRTWCRHPLYPFLRVLRSIDVKGAAPAQHVIEYELNDEHTTNHSYYSKYSGTPTDEQDAAWDDLMRPVYFNASLEEVIKAEETVRDNLAVVAEGGYLANLAVYHELHCLRQLRFWLYKDRYYPNITEIGDKHQHEHLDHCLETLRLSVMCSANTALYTFYWEDEGQVRPNTQSNSRSVCVKWGPLEKWAYSRRVPAHVKYNKTSISSGKE